MHKWYTLGTVPKKKKQTLSLVHHAKRWLIPHKGNGYHPHLIRWKGLTAVLVLALGIQISYGFVTTGKFEVLGRASNISATELIADTNVQREAVGLGDLTLNDELSQAAFSKAKDMFANNYWAHESPSGITPWKWLADAGYNYDVAGENLAKNYPNAQATVDAWMASPTHKANVLGMKYQDVGFAVVDGTLNGQETTLVVAYYGAPVSAVAAATDQKTTYVSPVNNGIGNPLAYFGSAIQSLSPATVGVLGLMIVVAFVAGLAHHYRYKLPKQWQKSWRLHHGAYKLAGVAMLAVVLIAATGGGQI
jgi:hypothetical protein